MVKERLSPDEFVTGNVAWVQWSEKENWPILQHRGHLENIHPSLRRFSGVDGWDLRDLILDHDWQAFRANVAKWKPLGASWRTFSLRLRDVYQTNPWIVALVIQSSDEVWEAMLTPMDNETRAGSRLFLAKERLELILQGTRLGMWDWNPQTNEVHFDQRWAEMLGYDVTEIEMHLDTWQKKVHPDDLEQCFADIQAHMNGETSFYENVHRMRHRHGHWVFILDRGKIVDWNEEGQPIRFTGTHTDITAQKELEIRAEQASQSKTIFLANVSHELRTPIHGMLGMVELLSRGNLDAEQTRYLAHISESGRSLLSLVNDLLEFSRMEASDLTLSEEDFTINDFVSMLRQQFEPQFGERGLSFSIEVSPHLPGEVRCDELRLKQVISNLLVNALKYTEHGSVRLRIVADSSYLPLSGLMVEVEDSGRGIKSENIERVFQSFVQEDYAGKPGQGGVGLGLSISKALVERMGGQLEIISDAGKGTIARFSIPIKNGQARIERKGASDLWFAENSFGILLVEDTPLNQLLMQRFLRFIGLECETVSSGSECLERVGRGGIDLVLLDLGLPDHSGLHVAREIRNGSSNQPYIIAVTADAFEDTRSKCTEAGINDFLPKPFDLEQLSARLGRFVEHSNSVRAGAALDL